MGSSLPRLLHTRMVCVCPEVTGRRGHGHVMLSITVLCVDEMAFQSSLIYCFAGIPPDCPFSMCFCNAKLFARLIWCRVSMGLCEEESERELSKPSMLQRATIWLPITSLVSVT